MPREPKRRFFLAWLPLIVCVVFVVVHATPTPLTDEWLFLRGAMKWSQSEPSIASFSDALVWRIYDHIVVIPFLIYLPVASLFGYDNRALVLVTIVCYAVLLWTLQRRFDPPAYVLFFLSLVIFSPARYMDFLWGFEFTLALSVLFSVLGLHVLDSIRTTDRGPRQVIKTTAGLALLACSVLSSAGGLAGWLAAVPLITMKGLGRRSTTFILLGLVLAGVGLHWLTHAEPRPIHIDSRTGLVVATAFGASIWSMPVGLTSFTFNVLSVTGGSIVLAAVCAFVRASLQRNLAEIALPISLVVFSVIAAVAISIRREYLGNWQLQFVVPGVCGAILATHTMWRLHKTRIDKTVWIVVCGWVSLSCAGYYDAFRVQGPSFHEYARSIERYMLTYEARPDQPLPYPPTGGWNIDRDMIEFLKSHDHPLFR